MNESGPSARVKDQQTTPCALRKVVGELGKKKRGAFLHRKSLS